MAQYRTAVVTGGASGIGLATALHLLSLPSAHLPPFRVLLLDLAPSPPLSLQPHLNTVPSRLRYLPANVTDHAALERAFQAAEAWEGGGSRIDVVAAIAGISQVLNSKEGKDPFLAGARRGVDGKVGKPDLRLVDINLGGVIQTVQLAVAYMREQTPDSTGHRGRIIVAGSTASLYAFPNEPLYGAAKHGVLGLTRSLAVPLLAEGITINALAPSLIATGIAGDPHAFDALQAANCVTPMSTVMRAVSIFLGEDGPSDTPEFVTGQIVECTLDTLSFRHQPSIQNADEARCLEKMWPREQIVRALALSAAIPRVKGVPWADPAGAEQAAVAAEGRWERVNVVVD